jgi:predicted GNAT family acetyltransferase
MTYDKTNLGIDTDWLEGKGLDRKIAKKFIKDTIKSSGGVIVKNR